MNKQQILKKLTDIRNERLYPDGVKLEFGSDQKEETLEQIYSIIK